MAPIYDSDLAKERWERAEWAHYELWEKVEERQRRRKRLWIFATAVVFLMLSAIPVIIDRLPKWKSREMTKDLALEIGKVKMKAALNYGAFRMRFTSPSPLNYVIEQVENCNSETAQLVQSATLGDPKTSPDFALLQPGESERWQVEGIVDQFCYDSLKGSQGAGRLGGLMAFGIVPVKDLTDARMDRISLTVLRGQSAEISFD